MAKSKTKQLVKPEESAKSIYERMKNDRQPYIQRAEECAVYTIPSLFPKEGEGGSTVYKTPYQSIGARGLNNLTAKLMLALFPPNSPFFRLSMSEEILREYAGKPEIQTEVEQALGKIERKVLKYLETNQIRITCSEAVKQLVVAGNALLFLPPKEGGIKLYKLNSYVIKRDAIGNIITIVAIDKIAYSALPEEVRTMVTEGKSVKPDEQFEIYTHIYRDGDAYYSYQEVKDKLIAGSEQTYPLNVTPWIPLRMVKVDGEDYGRGFIEEYLGDLRSLEILTKAIVEISAIASRIIFLVNPNGITKVKRLNDAESGEYVAGREEDVKVLQLDKYSDLQVAKETANGIEGRLSYAFMLNSSVQRNAERVTAEEIRFVASELEDTLGGVYSILSQELQLPLVRRVLSQMMSTGIVPELPDKAIEPQITTGLEALGRGHDLNKLTVFLEYISKMPDAMGRLKMGSFLSLVGTSLGLDLAGIIKTDEEIAMEQQQAQQMAMMEKAVPNLSKGFVDANQGQEMGG